MRALNSPPQAAEKLLTTTHSLERWRTAGTGPAFIKIGRRVAYTDEDLDAFIAANRRERTGERRPHRRTHTRPERRTA
jgi:hypothetical protein